MTFDLTSLVGIGLLCLDCRSAADSNASLSVSYPEETVSYNVMVQDCRVYVPISRQANGDIVSLVPDREVEVENVEIFSLDAAEQLTDAKTGTWMTDDYERMEVEYGTGITSAGSYACINDGSYLYSAQASQVSVYDIRGDEPELVKEIPDIRSARHMKLSADGNYLFITARSNGVYILAAVTLLEGLREAEPYLKRLPVNKSVRTIAEYSWEVYLTQTLIIPFAEEISFPVSLLLVLAVTAVSSFVLKRICSLCIR